MTIANNTMKCFAPAGWVGARKITCIYAANRSDGGTRPLVRRLRRGCRNTAFFAPGLMISGVLTPRSVHPLRALAGCASAAALVMLTGCTGAEPSGRVPTPAAASTADAAQVGSTASTVPSDSTVSSRTTAPAAVRATVPPTPSSANQPPTVRSISSVPEQVNPLDCRPPNPPERPEVIVKVDDLDDPVETLEVRLQYSSGTGSYQGDVRMRFDATRQAFVYRLPPVTRAAVGNDARNIMIAVDLPSPSPAPPPPPTHWIQFKGYCLDTPPAGH